MTQPIQDAAVRPDAQRQARVRRGSPWKASRLLLTLGCLACAIQFATQARWQAKLQHPSGAYLFQLPRAPLWDPPPFPTYAEFQRTFSGPLSAPRSFPPEPECTTVRVLSWKGMLFEALLWLWLTTAVVSIFYPWDRRDRMVRTAAFAFLGLTGGACATVSLWLIHGGWGPPMPHYFGLFGLSVGLTYALATMGRVSQRAAADGGPS